MGVELMEIDMESTKNFSIELQTGTLVLVVAPAGYETAIYAGCDSGTEFIMAEQIMFQGGGHGGNLAYYLAQLGVAASLCTYLGDDWPGQMALKGLEHPNIDRSAILVCPGESSQSNYLLIKEGEKQVVMNFGSALEQSLDVFLSKIPPIVVTSLLPVKAALNIMEQARHEGSKTIVSVQLPSSVTESLGLNHAKLEQGIARADYLMGSTSVLAQEFALPPDPDKIAQLLYQRFPHLKACIVTAGKEGCAAFDGSRHYLQPAFPVPVIDSTGGGDLFLASFVNSHLRQHKPLDISLREAAAWSALACKKAGSRVEIEPAEADALLRDEGNKR